MVLSAFSILLSSLRTRWLIELLFPFLCYVGLVGLSKRGYNAKKRSEAALITAQNGMFFSIFDVVFFTVYSIPCCGILEVLVVPCGTD